MADVERRIRQALQEEAGRAPAGTDLLTQVHTRSRRLARRRRAATAAAAVVGVSVGVLVALGGHPDAEPPRVRVVAAAPTPSTTVTTPGVPTPAEPAAPRTPTTPPSTAPTVLTLTGSSPDPVTFPFSLDPAVAGLMRPRPTVTLSGGVLQAAYEARDGEADADITLAVTMTAPTFAAVPVRVDREAQRVRGHDGVLRTAQFRPTRQYTLAWQESPGLWLQLRTDDTYTVGQVVRFADGLRASRITADPPFTFRLVPAGATITELTAATTALSAPAADRGAAVVVTLLTPRRPRGEPVRVGTRTGALTADATGTHLMVAAPGGGGTLLVSVAHGYALTRSELARLAEGIQVTRAAVPAAHPTG